MKPKHKVTVEWKFAQRAEVKTVPNIDGQPLAVVTHQFVSEGIPIKRVYCYGCKRYFASWTETFRYHKLAEKGGKAKQSR